MSTKFVRNLEVRQMEQWARLTSDFNPMHLDPEFTQGTPYGRPIVFATLTLAVVSEALEREFGERWTDGGTLDVRLIAPVFVGDEFSVSAGETGGSTQVECLSGITAPFVLSLELGNPAEAPAGGLTKPASG